MSTSESLEERELFMLTRKRRGVTQQAIADRIGVSQAVVSYIETGRWEATHERWCQMWTALEVAAGELDVDAAGAEEAVA